MEIFVPLSIILLIKVSMAYFDYIKAKTIDELYASINVGDHLRREKKDKYGPPWANKIIKNVIVTKKENRWIQVKDDNGRLIDISFDYYNSNELKLWKKIRMDIAHPKY